MNARLVLVTRPTAYQQLLWQHGTAQNAKFYLSTRGGSLQVLLEQHEKQQQAVQVVSAQIPADWRRAQVSRQELDRFSFEPEDIVVAVGQDGLIPNIAKYLQGQLVIGINPDPRQYSGLLVRHAPQQFRAVLDQVQRYPEAAEQRTLAQATLDDGQNLLALNELFVGHRSHQTARYRLEVGSGIAEERQMSSGLIVTTGTGASGWARSICGPWREPPALPAPTEARLVFLVREAFASVTTGTEHLCGSVDQQHLLTIISEMDEGGVIFGDGLEGDYLNFSWGQRLEISPAERTLRLG